MTRLHAGLLVAASFVAAGAGRAAAAPNLVLSHQGHLLDATDRPIDAASQPFTFRLFALGATVPDETPIWSSGECATPVRGGFYAVTLGGDCGTALLASYLPPSTTRYLEVVVNGSVLAPRLRIGTVPTAAHAANADALGGVPAAGYWAKSEDVDAAKVGGLAAAAFWQKTEAVDAATLGGAATGDYWKKADEVDAATFGGRSPTQLQQENDARYARLGAAQTITAATTFTGPTTLGASDGASPFAVGNAGKVTNLNADQLDGHDAEHFATAASLDRYLPLAGGTLQGALALPANGLAVGGTQLVTAGGKVGIGTSTFGAHGALQIAGDLGFTGARTIRAASNADTDSLRLLATQVVAGASNSAAYSYAGNGLFAARSNADAQLLVDAGRISGSAAFQVRNTSGGEIAMNLSNAAGGSVFHAGTNTGRVGIGSASPQALLDVANALVVDPSKGVTKIHAELAEFGGSFTASENHPACDQTAWFVDLGDTTGARGFIDIELHGDHRSGNSCGSASYDRWVLSTGDMGTRGSRVVTSTLTTIKLNIQTTGTAAANVAGSGNFLRLEVPPVQCGCDRSYQYNVRFTPSSFTPKVNRAAHH